MRLTCQKVLLLVLASTLGCDSTGPGTGRLYTLDNINGRPLPTYLAATPGLTPTILDATLRLDDSGTAVITEHRRYFDGSEATITNTSTYTVSSNEIVIESFWPCPINAICLGKIRGELTDGMLSLAVAPLGGSDAFIIYNYRAPVTEF